uniref:Uncharacterized protein n=1 Tax=Ditylenchus dipsaci TaxID=166011 RepID=A0A915ECP7_9BILA
MDFESSTERTPYFLAFRECAKIPSSNIQLHNDLTGEMFEAFTPTSITFSLLLSSSAIVFFKSIFLGGCFFVVSINWIRFVVVKRKLVARKLKSNTMASTASSGIQMQSSRLEQGTSSAAVSAVGSEPSGPWYKSGCFRIFLGLFGLCVLLSIVIFLTYKLVKIDYPDAVPTLATPSPEKPTSTTRRRSTTSSPKPTELVKTTIDGGSLTLPAIVFTHRSTSVRTSTSSQKTHTASSTTQSPSEGTSSTLPPSTPSSSPPTDSMKTTLDGGDLQLPALVFKPSAVVDDVSHGLIHRSRKPKV